jgi:hypothetical protein
MLKNFEESKKQLSELAEVINLYKSEAVQLKIVELIFERSVDDPGTYESSKTTMPRRTRGSKKGKLSKHTRVPGSKSSPSRGSKMGSVTVLNRLLEEGFFDSRRKIGDIVDHSRLKLATTIKVSDFSGPLARYVREGKLDRETNSDGQFEYIKK